MTDEGKSVLSPASATSTDDLLSKLTDGEKAELGDRWLGSFERLREYGTLNGNLDVPQKPKESVVEKFKGLGGWINKVGSGEEVCRAQTHQLT